MLNRWGAINLGAASCVKCWDDKDVDVNPTPYFIPDGVNPKTARLIFVGRNPGRLLEARYHKEVVARYRALKPDSTLEERTAAKSLTFQGSLMHSFAETIGFEDYIFLNVVKCATVDNIAPSPAVTSRCNPWLQEQLDILVEESYRVIVTLGWDAAKFVDPHLHPQTQLNPPSLDKRFGFTWVRATHPASRTYASKHAEKVKAAVEKALSLQEVHAW